MTKWISVKKKLPKKSGNYILCLENSKNSFYGYFDSKGTYNTISGKTKHFWVEGRDVYPDYWMKFPKPPKSNN